ncbi:MAG TPA: hypothetical protein VF868_13995 [Bacteroidia bacterium]|jgi:hypothetical protein
MIRFNIVLVLFLSCLVFSCKSSQDVSETAKAEEPSRKEAAASSTVKPEVKSTTEKVPNQTLSNPGANPVNPNGPRPR